MKNIKKKQPRKKYPHDIGEAGPGQCGRTSRVAFVKHGEIVVKSCINTYYTYRGWNKT